MIQLLDLANLPANVTRAERQYLEYVNTDHADPSKQHRIIIDVLTDTGYVPAFLYEFSDETIRNILAEFTPLWQRTHVSPFCTCDLEYQQAQNAIMTLESAVCTFCVTTESLKSLKEKLSRTVYQRVKSLEGQLFFSMQDAADMLLRTVLEPEQVKEYGMVIINELRETGIDELARQTRIASLEATLSKFHGNIPARPMPPSDEPCPYCHRQYKYSFFELVAAEQSTFQRIRTLLTGDYPIASSSLPRIVAAVESWFFTDDSDIFTKKNTLTGMLMTQLKTWYQQGIMSLQMSLASSNSKTADSTASASTPSDVTPPPPPPDIHIDN